MNQLKLIAGRRVSALLAALTLTVIMGSVSWGQQTTAFSYQGKLDDLGVAANGTYDLQFSLFDLVAGGSQQGATQTVTGVAVQNGIFTVELDFGGTVFDGSSRFMQIAVKKPADGSYTPLNPRQRIASVPYATRARSVEATTAGDSIVNAINNGATTLTIDSSNLSADVVKLKPGATQVSTSVLANGTDPMLDLRGSFTTPIVGNADFKVLHSGGFVATGFVRDVGNTTGCAALIPATGAGTRFMWHPCRGSLRFGRVPTAQTNWDDANMDDFTFAGGNQVTASGYGAFAYGDQVSVSSTVGVGFGSGVNVSGTAGFSAGASNICSGFACTAIGYTVTAGGQGSVALGYRTTANNDYSVAIGYRASNNTHTGSMVMGDESTTTDVNNQADNEFRARYNGGFRLRVSTAANGNTPGAGGNVGCDLTVAVPSWTCASSRDVKENFKMVKGEEVLSKLRGMPFMTFNYINDKSLTRNFGPVAEDFYKAFKLGDSDKSINVQNMASVSLAGVQALEARTATLQKENDALRSTLNALEARLKKLENKVTPRSKRSAKRRY